MMIKSFNTHVAIIAVSCSWGSEDEAGVAKLNFQRMSFNCACIINRLHFTYTSIYVFLGNWNSLQFLQLILSINFGYDAGISKGQDHHEKDTQEVEGNG